MVISLRHTRETRNPCSSRAPTPFLRLFFRRSGLKGGACMVPLCFVAPIALWTSYNRGYGASKLRLAVNYALIALLSCISLAATAGSGVSHGVQEQQYTVLAVCSVWLPCWSPDAISFPWPPARTLPSPSSSPTRLARCEDHQARHLPFHACSVPARRVGKRRQGARLQGRAAQGGMRKAALPHTVGCPCTRVLPWAA